MQNHLKFPKFYAIVDAETCARFGVTAGGMARDLRDAGVCMVQYRDKVNGPQKILRDAKQIADAFAGKDAMLVMNDRADLAALLGWGVHVGQGDLAVENVRRVLGANEKSRSPAGMTTRNGKGNIIGVSTHNEKQVLCCAQNDNSKDSNNVESADYLAIGPVFATGTKADASPVVGLEGVRHARRLTAKPLVAIGGITLQNARSVIDAGVDSVAVISGLFIEGMTVTDVARHFLAILS